MDLKNVEITIAKIQKNIISPENFCGSCDSYCLMCKNKALCTKCLDGFILKRTMECDWNKDIIHYDKFKETEKFIPSDDLCGYNEYNLQQLFSFQLSYVITEGENLAIESETYNDVVFGINDDKKYGLNCILEVNPIYIPNGQYYGSCKQIICPLKAFINCSFHETVPDDIYTIQVNSNNSNYELAELLRKGIRQYSPIEIYYIYSKITPSFSDNSIQVTYKGYSSYYKIYLCPNINSNMSDCYELKDCISSYNDNNEETVLKCGNTINYNESGCINYERILLEDYCLKYMNESLSYQYCSDKSNDSDYILFINLFVNLFILLLII